MDDKPDYWVKCYPNEHFYGGWSDKTGYKRPPRRSMLMSKGFEKRFGFWCEFYIYRAGFVVFKYWTGRKYSAVFTVKNPLFD